MDYMPKLKEIIETTVKRAEQEQKTAMFSIATTANVNNKEVLFPGLRETNKTVCGNVLLNSERYLERIIKEIDGAVGIILVDAETKVPEVADLEIKIRRLAKKSKIFTFRPNDLTVDAADALIAQLKYPLKDKKIGIIGAGNVGSKLAIKLVERGSNVYLSRRDGKKLKKIVDGLNIIKSNYIKSRAYCATSNQEASKNAEIIVGTAPGTPAITKEMVKSMRREGLILDVGNSTLFPDAFEETKKRNIKVICLSMKPGYDGALETILQTEKVIRNQGKKDLGDFSMISGGVLGKRGDIIVDDANAPTKIFAIADGKGDVIPDISNVEFKKNMNTVKKLLRGAK